MKKALVILFIIVPLLAVSGLATFVSMKLRESYTGPDKTFVVRNGDTFGKINQRLYEEGLISDKRLFHYYAKYKDVLTRFQAGTFTIPKGSNLMQVLEILVYGQPNLTSITIPEGRNMYEIAKMLEAAGITSEKEFLEAVQHPDLLSKLEIHANSLEGYLYPETYRFAPNTPARTVAKSMIDLFNERT
ncbi:MAG: endolytic transglycosylase MltG, partial [Bacteriovoracia bacterium]